MLIQYSSSCCITLLLMFFELNTVDITEAQSDGDLRLMNGQVSDLPSRSGRLEIYLNSEWGTVCDDGFGITEANVACRQLGFAGALNYGNSINLGFSTGKQIIHLDDVNCSTHEAALHILSCNYSRQHDCNHNEDVAVVCNSTYIWEDNLYDGRIRLKGGKYPSLGRLEVYCNGRWGTVCDDLFGFSEADTVCQQLGYTSATSYDHLIGLSGDYFQPIWLDNVQCSAAQPCLSFCQTCPETENHDCAHSEDVTVQCTYDRLSNVSPSQLKTCVLDSSISIGVIIGSVVACILTLCCCIIAVVIVIICIAIFRKKQERSQAQTNDTKTHPHNPNQILSPSIEGPVPPPRPCDLPALSPSPTISQGIYEEIPQAVVYDEQPVYIAPGNDRLIYIRPPAGTSSPPPYPGYPSNHSTLPPPYPTAMYPA